MTEVLTALAISVPLYMIWTTLPSGYDLLSVLREIRDHLKGIRDQNEPWNKR